MQITFLHTRFVCIFYIFPILSMCYVLYTLSCYGLYDYALVFLCVFYVFVWVCTFVCVYLYVFI